MQKYWKPVISQCFAEQRNTNTWLKFKQPNGNFRQVQLSQKFKFAREQATRPLRRENFSNRPLLASRVGGKLDESFSHMCLRGGWKVLSRSLSYSHIFFSFLTKLSPRSRFGVGCTFGGLSVLVSGFLDAHTTNERRARSVCVFGFHPSLSSSPFFRLLPLTVTPWWWVFPDFGYLEGILDKIIWFIFEIVKSETVGCVSVFFLRNFNLKSLL